MKIEWKFLGNTELCPHWPPEKFVIAVPKKKKDQHVQMAIVYKPTELRSLEQEKKSEIFPQAY